jgi:hypothetical protein
VNDEPAPRRCGLYLPGHEVHWIQGLRCGNDLESPRIDGTLISIEADGTIVLKVDGRTERAWNHEPNRLAVLAARVENHVTLQRRWGALRVPSPRGAYVFYIGDPDDHRQCPPTPPSGDPIELLIEAGGFSISMDEAIERFSLHDET